MKKVTKPRLTALKARKAIDLSKVCGGANALGALDGLKVSSTLSLRAADNNL